MLGWKWLPAVMVVMGLGGCQVSESPHPHDTVTEFFETVEHQPMEPSLVRDELVEPEGLQQIVSIVVDEGLPLGHVFEELSRQSGIMIVVAPQVRGGEISGYYAAKERPLIQVLEELCALTSVRYRRQGDRVIVEEDMPYVETYELSFLSHVRSQENSMSITTDVFTVMEGSRGRVDNGSKSHLASAVSNDFWQELQENLQLIVGEGDPLPFRIHKQAGLITVKGNFAEHERVREYLDRLRKSTGTQVLIEARILEVNLYDEFRSGINWSVLGNSLSLSSPMGSLSAPGSLNVSTGLQRDVFTFAVDYKDFASVFNFVKTFGVVRTLSNPRMTVMNNQPAMLKVATNEVFFQLEFDRYFQADGKPDVENFSSNIMTVPIGLVLIVQPAIDHCTGEITLTLRPTVSRIDKFVEDPAVAIKSNQRVASRIPVVQVREIDSVLKLRSGSMVVLGGLMEERSRDATAGVPGVDDVPLLGFLTRGEEKENRTSELVIFLTARVLG